MKTVGMIGGLGPETTSKFYLELINLCQKLNNIHRPEMLISSVPLPYDIEEDAIARGTGEERCIPFLVNAARKLEKSGADFLVMPCNSLHTFIEDVRSSVNIPVLSIVEETTDYLVKKNINLVGIISTSITLKNRLYDNSLATKNIKQVVPNDNQQAEIGKMIHGLVSNRYDNNDRDKLIEIINSFKEKGVKHVVLACTDLQLLAPHHPTIKIYDSMKILAEATTNEILEKPQ